LSTLFFSLLPLSCFFLPLSLSPLPIPIPSRHARSIPSHDDPHLPPPPRSVIYWLLILCLIIVYK
jgi:hypothetical protein